MVGVDGKWWIDMLLRILGRNILDRVQIWKRRNRHCCVEVMSYGVAMVQVKPIGGDVSGASCLVRHSQGLLALQWEVLVWHIDCGSNTAADYVAKAFRRKGIVFQQFDNPIPGCWAILARDIRCSRM
ncbi:hypothetical protein GOBAR_DD08832 [Gossypium barbadense]|nr:hypothetical protein GOBAR_DD08832 [Gossypium barbadense]